MILMRATYNSNVHSAKCGPHCDAHPEGRRPDVGIPDHPIQVLVSIVYFKWQEFFLKW
jgi:hypothetical protein